MFHVRWAEAVLKELTSVWTSADSTVRQAITQATNQIDPQLQIDPLGPSESRLGGRRVLFAAPLGVLFRIEANEQIVSVIRVWLFHRRIRP